MNIVDPLYGPLQITGPIRKLVVTPAIQRLRYIRLSNVDSLNLPGVSAATRYEHSIGAWYLSTCLDINRRISSEDSLVLQAAAMLHDWAIPPFSHLLEEAAEFAGIRLDHEGALGELHRSETSLGNENLQILFGHESGIRNWLKDSFGVHYEHRLVEIEDAIEGRPPWGSYVSAAIDVDNLDNIPRAAYHMGLGPERGLGLGIARNILDINDGEIVTTPEGNAMIRSFLDLRSSVYTHFMMAPLDFAGKMMLVVAAGTAFEQGLINRNEVEWYTDFQLLDRLSSAKKHPFVANTIQRWMLGDLWWTSSLVWVTGARPDLAELGRHAKSLGDEFGRRLFAYGINDKRARKVIVREGSSREQYGADSSIWLLGVCSDAKSPFSLSEERELVDGLVRRLGMDLAAEHSTDDLKGDVKSRQRSLF